MCERLSRGFSAARPFLASNVLAAVLFSATDVATWPTFRSPPAIVATVVFGIANGAAMAFASTILVWAPVRLLARRRAWAGIAGGLVVALVLTMLAGIQVMVVLKGTSVGSLLLLALGCLLASGILSLGITELTGAGRVPRRLERHQESGLLVVGTMLLGLDRTLFAAVVEAPYSFVEGVAHVALALVGARWLSSRPRLATFVVATGATVLLLLGVSRSLRLSLERSLPTLWEQPVYATRLTRRVHLLESLVRKRANEDRLARKYGLDAALGVDDAWHGPSRPGAGLDPTVQRPSGTSTPNVVVFFVDTLRADVARDPAVMPGTVEWMTNSVSFARVYSSGSSTLLTLAPMLGCRYDAQPTDPPRLLDVARAAGMTTGLVIAQSAFDYHRVAFPTFRFEHQQVVADSDGRRLPTASAIVESSLAWLRTAKPDRFFLWVYQYDVHSWGDLDDTYVENESRAGGFSKSDAIHWRYRAAARGVDRAFTRLRAGLEELGLADDTVVLFVSDHGEGLGDRNFWAHSTYLWESLIRVPMGIRVPGVAGRVVNVPVSTVDVATTLATLVGSAARTSGCHGVDLLAADREPRALPILFSAMIDGRLARIGMLGGHDRKLVFDLRDVDARLLRVTDGSVDEEDVSYAEPGQLSLRLAQLLRAPIYPQAY